MDIHKALKEKSRKGKWVSFHYKDNKNHKYRGVCVDEVVAISHDYAHRLQKIIWCQEKKNLKKKEWANVRKNKLWSTVRACYWVINRNKDKIVFGQFCMNSYPKVVGKLFKKADKKGFFKETTKNQMLRELRICPKSRKFFE